MTIKRFILLIVTFACICANNTYAQYGELSDDQKAKIIYEIPRSLIWENDEDINLIYIGVVNGSPQFLRTLRKEAKKAYPGSGTKVMVEEYASVEEKNKDMWMESGTANNCADYEFKATLDGHEGVFGGKDEFVPFVVGEHLVA